MGLEPYEGRYTLQLEDWSRTVFERRGIEYISVPGVTIDNTKSIQVGQVLDAHGRSYFSMSQMMNLELLTNNLIGCKYEDWFKKYNGIELIEYTKEKNELAIKTIEDMLCQ